mgnify:FL=1
MSVVPVRARMVDHVGIKSTGTIAFVCPIMLENLVKQVSQLVSNDFHSDKYRHTDKSQLS